MAPHIEQLTKALADRVVIVVVSVRLHIFSLLMDMVSSPFRKSTLRAFCNYDSVIQVCFIWAIAGIGIPAYPSVRRFCIG